MRNDVGLTDLAPDSKVWIFAPNPLLKESDVSLLEERLNEFASSWVSHDNKLKCGATVLYNQFAIIAVDNSFVVSSGCSMDTLHRFISTLNIEFEVDFLNRNVFQYLDDGAVKLIKQGELKTALQENKITSKTLFFDKLVDKLDDLRSEFLKPIDSFWMAQLV